MLINVVRIETLKENDKIVDDNDLVGKLLNDPFYDTIQCKHMVVVWFAETREHRTMYFDGYAPKVVG